MKKTFLARRNALISSARFSWGAISIAVVVLMFFVRLIAPNFFIYIFSPVFRVSDSLATQSHLFFSGFNNAIKLTLQNERLKEENSALANENQALLVKVTSLGGLDDSNSGIIAAVVARPPTSPYDTLIVSRGAKDEVVVGMEVFGSGGVPVGIVSSVLSDFSRITLFSASSMSVDGWIGKDNLPVTLHGAGGGALRASVARAAGILVGDIVFAPGPGMLPVGDVVRVDSDPSSPSVVLQIRLRINPFSIDLVDLRSTGPAFVSSLTFATSKP